MNDFFEPISEALQFAFETLSPFFPFLLTLFFLRIVFIAVKHIVYGVESSSGDDKSDSVESDGEENEQEDSPGSISVYSVLLDKEIFHWDGDYAKEVKKDRLTVYYTDDGINKSFSCDLDDHIVVKEP